MSSVRYNKGAEYEHATLSDLVKFKAATPFQYRILMPSIALAAERVMAAFKKPLDIRQFFHATDLLALLATWFFFSLLIRAVIPIGINASLLVALTIYIPLYLSFIM